ncbi:MAG: glycosyltransferase family 9 protein [Deferrisomatales bacterium]
MVFRNGSIGNTLVSTPLLESLKVRTGAHLAVVVDPLGRELLEGLPFVDRLIVYDKRARHRSLWSTARFVRDLARGGYDTAILAKRFFRNELIAWLAGIPRRIGFATENVRPFRLTHTVPYVEGRNLVDLNLELLSALGLEPVTRELRIAVDGAPAEAAGEYLRSAGLAGREFFALHLGGQTSRAGNWAADRCAELCRGLLARYPADLVLLAGPGEREFNEQLRGGVPPEARSRVSICGTLPLRSVAALIGSSSLFVGNDSGPSHLADAVGKRSVIFYWHPTDVRAQVAKWKPRGERFAAVYSPDGDLGGVSVEQALAEVDRVCRSFPA